MNPDGTARRGSNAVAAAAYRAGARMRCERTGVVHDYSRRKGMAHAEIMAPKEAPAWMRDRSRLWNTVEQGEKRKDAQLAREINMALPHELDDAGRLALVRAYVQSQFVDRGMVADVAIHKPVPERGDDPRNHHAHVMLTLRKATREGFFRTKTREWNADTLMGEWREAWAEHQNRALERAGRPERVDHRSLSAQRSAALNANDRARAAVLDREPEIHVGARATNAQRAERSIQSRERSRGKRCADPAHQVVRYGAIDTGTRHEANARCVARNVARLGRMVERWQLRSANYRARERSLLRQSHALEQQQRQAERENRALMRRLGLGPKTPAPMAARLRRRSQQVQRIVGEIDAVIAALLGSRERHLARLARLQNRLRERPRGRGRARRPSW